MKLYIVSSMIWDSGYTEIELITDSKQKAVELEGELDNSPNSNIVGVIDIAYLNVRRDEEGVEV